MVTAGHKKNDELLYAQVFTPVYISKLVTGYTIPNELIYSIQLYLLPPLR